MQEKKQDKENSTF